MFSGVGSWGEEVEVNDIAHALDSKVEIDTSRNELHVVLPRSIEGRPGHGNSRCSAR